MKCIVTGHLHIDVMNVVLRDDIADWTVDTRTYHRSDTHGNTAVESQNALEYTCGEDQVYFRHRAFTDRQTEQDYVT